MIAAMLRRSPPRARRIPPARPPSIVASTSGLRARRAQRAIARAFSLGLGLLLTAPVPVAVAAAEAGEPPARLVSLNPSLTAILARLGAGDQVVGIDDYSARIVPALGDRPRVGGLFDPSLEAVMALRPDRVLIVAGVEQTAHADALRRLGVVVEVFENERYEQVLDNIERLGRLTQRTAAAVERIEAIRATRAAVERATRGRERPLTVIVLDRSPLYLVGDDTFLDELLEAVGAENLGARLAGGYPRGSLEWLVAAGPALLLDLSPQSEGPGDALAFWRRWPSLPAVQTGRVLALDATTISLPGPDLDRALRVLAEAVHGRALGAAIDRELGERAAP